MICYDLHTITRLLSGWRNKHSEFKPLFNNFLVIWSKLALNESHIVDRFTQNTRNTVMPDTEYFENLVPKLQSGCKMLVI